MTLLTLLYHDPKQTLTRIQLISFFDLIDLLHTSTLVFPLFCSSHPSLSLSPPPLLYSIILSITPSFQSLSLSASLPSFTPSLFVLPHRPFYNPFFPLHL